MRSYLLKAFLNLKYHRENCTFMFSLVQVILVSHDSKHWWGWANSQPSPYEVWKKKDRGHIKEKRCWRIVWGSSWTWRVGYCMVAINDTSLQPSPLVDVGRPRQTNPNLTRDWGMARSGPCCPIWLPCCGNQVRPT